MCGIVGILGREDVADRLLDGLKRLEYRGYDSAGICTVHDDAFDRRRAPGKLVNLAQRLAEEPLPTLLLGLRLLSEAVRDLPGGHPGGLVAGSVYTDGLFDRARGRMVGSNEYLTKPFTKESLLRSVAAHAAAHPGATQAA